MSNLQDSEMFFSISAEAPPLLNHFKIKIILQIRDSWFYIFYVLNIEKINENDYLWFKYNQNPFEFYIMFFVCLFVYILK